MEGGEDKEGREGGREKVEERRDEWKGNSDY